MGDFYSRLFGERHASHLARNRCLPHTARYTLISGPSALKEASALADVATLLGNAASERSLEDDGASILFTLTKASYMRLYSQVLRRKSLPNCPKAKSSLRNPRLLHVSLSDILHDYRSQDLGYYGFMLTWIHWTSGEQTPVGTGTRS